MSQFHYHQGELVAVRGETSFALLDDRNASPDAAFGLMAAIGSANPELMRVAADQALAALPAVGVAWSDATGWHAVVGGEIHVAYRTPCADTVIRARGESHTVDVPVDAVSLRLSSGGADSDATTELAGGAVRASVVEAVLAPDTQGRLMNALQAEASSPEQALDGSPSADEAHDVVVASAAAASEPVAVVAVVPSVHEASVAHPPPPPSIPLPVQTLPAPTAPPPPTSVPQVHATPTDPPPTTQQVRLVDLSAPPDAAPAALPTEDEGSSENSAISDALQVLGVRCPVDHHNHPDAQYCSQCGRRMGVNHTTVAMMGPRPPLGLFLIDDVATYSIAADFVIGRDPASHPDVAEGMAALMLEDDALEISRAHVEILLDGWNVTARDLGSSNGTSVRRTDSDRWESLSTSTPATLTAGDALRIGQRELQLELHHVQT